MQDRESDHSGQYRGKGRKGSSDVLWRFDRLPAWIPTHWESVVQIADNAGSGLRGASAESIGLPQKKKAAGYISRGPGLFPYAHL